MDDINTDDFSDASDNESLQRQNNADNLEQNVKETDAVDVVSVKKRVVRNPQPKLNADRLNGPRGIVVLKDWFKNFPFEGKGHEKKDLDAVMCRLEQWTHRLFPKYTFDDALSRIEKLGHKSQVSNYVKRIRLDLVDDCDKMEIREDTIENEETTPTDLPFSLDRTSTQTVAVVQNTLTDEQREKMIRNRLLAEERRMARTRLQLEQKRNDEL